MNVLDKVLNLVVLNLCFIISSIPIVTIGAAATALYSVNLKMIRNEESYVFSSYWQEFRSNFRQSTVCWLLLVCAGGLLGADFLALRILPEVLQIVFGAAAMVFLVIYSVTALYVFPYMARFQDALGKCVKNSLFMGCSNLGYTGTAGLIIAAAAVLTVSDIEVLLRGVYLWMIIGFSLLNYINSFFFRKVFDKYEA